MEEQINIGSLDQSPSQIFTDEPPVQPKTSENSRRKPLLVPQVIAGLTSLVFFVLAFFAGQQLLGPLVKTAKVETIDNAQTTSNKEVDSLPEVYVVQPGDSCSLEFTVSAVPACLETQVTDLEGNQITDFASLGVGDQLRLKVNGSFSSLISKARFQINQGADDSWCQGINLSLIDNWCETTDKDGDYYYIDYTIGQSGNFAIGAMIFDSANQTWY